MSGSRPRLCRHMNDPDGPDGDTAPVPGPSTGPDPQRLLTRAEGGILVDSLTGRRISSAELADDVRGGRRFRARDSGGGECTYQVLVQVLLAALASGPEAGALPEVAGLPSAEARGSLPTGRTAQDSGRGP